MSDTEKQRPHKIAILDDFQGVSHSMADWSALTGRAEITAFRDHISDPSELAARLEPFHIVCAMRERTPLPGSLLEALPNLKLIITTGMSNAVIDVSAATRCGITVCGTRANYHVTPEFVWALLLATVRHVPQEAARVRAGQWQSRIGLDLHGRTLGVVGLGNIGKIVARVAGAFGMTVLAWSQNLTDDAAVAAGARHVTKQELFEQSDIVSIHLVMSERSRGLVGEQELAWMKPTAYLINTSRGPIVSEAALIDALRSGKIAGAGLDVFDVEPLPQNHPFRSLDNVVATPHIGYVTDDMYRLFYGDIVEAIAGWLNGSPVRVLGN